LLIPRSVSLADTILRADTSFDLAC